MAVLRKIRIGTDITLGITVMASGHAVDWDSQDIKHVYAFSDIQGQPVAEMSYEQRGSTLRCVFHAEDQNYVGAYRVIIEFNDGSAFSSTLDMPAFEIVRTSEEADIDTGEIVLDIDGSMRFYSLAEVISKLEGLHTEVKAAASAAREASDNANAAAKKANDAAALANSNASKAEASNKVINDNERKRIAQETARESAEAERKRAELERQKGDESIANKEAERERNEETRETNEQTREDNELERRNAESARNRAEAQRASRETTRISNETSRQAAENKRVAAETLRKEAETSRVNVESERVTEFARLKKESEEATKTASAVSDVVAQHTTKITKIEQLLQEGYTFMGVATPETDPGTPDQKVFYIANGKGTYANFGGLVVDEDEVVLLIFKDVWNKMLSGIASYPKLTELTAELGQYVSPNNEYIRAYTDLEGRFLWGIRHDGSIEFAKGVPTPIKEYVAPIFFIKDYFGLLNDIEGRFELTTDAENKVLAYRDVNGKRVETKLKITHSFELEKQAMQKFQNALKSSGFNVESPTDWSALSSIKLPISRSCAKVNIISETGLAKTKTDDKKCILEYWDKDGNYFRKHIILNAQGSSSMAYIEKNQGIDLFNDAECTESCEVIFDNWVAQDSFHLKCYYIDVFRGVANMAYDFCEEVIQFLNCRNNRVILNSSSITASNSTGNFDVDFGDGALCHPDGFPFEMYVNGEYYGLFAWNLKKHRKNYSMNKKDYSAALLDGILDNKTFFGGVIDWTAFELRNPKDLVTMDGREYDADTNCNELIDSTSSAYDANNPTHVKTAQVKALVERQAQALSIISSLSDESEAKEMFEQYYDKLSMICYYIVSNVVYNYDGFRKNWIWTIYDKIAAPSFYDMDSIFGRSWNGTQVVNNSTSTILGNELGLPTNQLVRLYKSEIDATYKNLRDAHIISVDNIMKYVNDWMERVGLDAYKHNIEAWPTIPSYRAEKTIEDGTAKGGFFDSSKRIELWLSARIQALDSYFNF